MQPTIHIRDVLALQAYLDADAPHILLHTEGDPGTVRVHLHEMRPTSDVVPDQRPGLDGGREGEGEG